jgi:hypothetical protein
MDFEKNPFLMLAKKKKNSFKVIYNSNVKSLEKICDMFSN